MCAQPQKSQVAFSTESNYCCQCQCQCHSGLSTVAWWGETGGAGLRPSSRAPQASGLQAARHRPQAFKPRATGLRPSSRTPESLLLHTCAVVVAKKAAAVTDCRQNKSSSRTMTWGARSLGNFRRRRRQVFATSNKRPYTKQPRELVRLSVEDRRAGRREIVQTLIFIAAEVLDILLDMSNFIFFINDSSARSYRTYRRMYIACTVLVTTFALYVLVKHITHLHHIRAEILVGIHVAKGRRSLMERSRSSEVMPADTVRESLECDDGSDLEEQAANVFPETAHFPNENILVEKSSMSSQSGVDSFEDANTSQQRVLELELERLQRRSTRAKLIVIGAFAEDLTTLLFALYRVGFTSYIVDEDFARCLLTNTSRAPVLCVSHQLGLVLLQLLGSSLLFALKVSFARDYYTLRSLAREMQDALRRETTQESSTLDLYKDGQVTTREINKVVQIRNICAFPGHSRYASDWLILQFLRLNRGDQVAAAQAVQSLLAWRRKHGASTIRRQLLTRDMAWDDIPNLSKINSVLPFVDAFKLDEQNAQLVQYAYIGSRADYPCLLRLIREEDLLKCALYLAERSLLLLESISNRVGRVHELTILCDARGSPDESGLLLFMRMLKSVCESLSHYPLRPKLILWKPSAELAELVRAYPSVHVVNSTKMLRILLSVECIPEELSGELRFGKQSEMLSKVDPWQLRQCRFAPLSKVLGHSEIDLHFYHDVSSAEANAVVSLRRLLAVIEKQVRNGSTVAAPASSYRSRGIIRRGNSTTQRSFDHQDISLPALRNRMKTFRAEGGALYKVSAEVASHLMLLRFVRKYMSAAELKHYEEIPSLRFDPHTFTRAPLGILAAAIAYVDTLIWRLRSKLDSLNARIKSEKMALCESCPHVTAVCNAAKLRPLMGFDSEHAQILAFFVEDAHPSCDASQNPLTQDMISSACAALFEYWLIILHAVSAQEERVVCVREFSHLDSYSRCIARPWANFHQVMQSLCSHYPLCIKSDGVMLVRGETRGAHFACRFKRAVSIVWQNTNWTEPARPRRGLTLEDATNLAKTVSPTMIPKDLGGSSEFKDVGNESLGTALAKYTSALQQALPIWSAPEGSPVDRFDGLPGRSSGQGGGPLVLRDSVKMYMPIKLPRFYTDSHINRTAQSPAEKSPLAMLMKGHTLQTLTATQHPPKAASESAPAPS